MKPDARQTHHTNGPRMAAKPEEVAAVISQLETLPAFQGNQTLTQILDTTKQLDPDKPVEQTDYQTIDWEPFNEASREMFAPIVEAVRETVQSAVETIQRAATELGIALYKTDAHTVSDHEQYECLKCGTPSPALLWCPPCQPRKP